VNTRVLLASALVAALVSTPAAAQDVIKVDVTSVLADVSRKPIGINVNFLLDDDENRANAIKSLSEALKEAGVRYLRYPGGEKSDNYLWSVPPYSSSVATLARWASGEWPQNQEWPSYDRQLVETDGHTFKTAPLDFDEFMTVCKAIDCVPTIVVCYDSMYKPAQPGGVAPTRAQLLETAREWVRYANVTKKYNVKYWEIGNESWLPHYNGSATAANYAKDLVQFSNVMKSVDPTILIGANGESASWWQTVLTGASSAIDFLAVHNYTSTNWGSYSYYQNNAVNLLSPVQAAQQAINTYAPLADRNRLTIATTEMNAADWSGGWAPVNDLGHALVVFDTFGAHLTNPRVQFTQMWNTRWSGNDTATTPVLWDALDKNNELQSTGRAAAIWGQFLKEKLVASSSTARVRTYSTYSPATGKLTVFLINKDAVARPVSVTVGGSSSANFAIETWVFGGDGPTDVSPEWGRVGETWNGGNVVAVTLPAVSITVLDIAPTVIEADVPGTIQAENFRDGGFWDSTAGNAGQTYRATDVDIQATNDAGGGFNVGWIAAGEWLEYVVRVSVAGYYDLSLRTASPYTGKSVSLLVDGTNVGAAIPIPYTGGWQTWKTSQRPNIYLEKGTHHVRIATGSGGFNLNWISFTPSAIGSVQPATVQAEDFDDGAFWDSTPGNYGAVYRTTSVDIQPTSDAGGGFNVGWIAPGEWLEYTINVSAAQEYDVSARVASPQTGSMFRILVDGVDVTGALAVPNTGSYQKWQTVTRARLPLASGTHKVRFVAVTSGFNLNWLTFTPSS
jgi:alpha-N-arabinofuranosidase